MIKMVGFASKKLPSLGNHLSHAFGKRMRVYITDLVYEIREMCHEVGKCWVGYFG
jgi:hypothetical protein